VADMLGLEVGDICDVIHSGKVYTQNSTFARNAGHGDIVSKEYVNRHNYELTVGRTVRILYMGCHQDYEAIMLAIVETIDSPYLKFIMNIVGLGPSREKLIDSSFVEEYLAESQGIPLNITFRKWLSLESVVEIIPDTYSTKLLIGAITWRNPMDIQFVNPDLITDEHYERILHKDGGLLGLIPEERRTLKLCQLAMLNEEYAIKFVPDNLKSLVKEATNLMKAYSQMTLASRMDAYNVV